MDQDRDKKTFFVFRKVLQTSEACREFEKARSSRCDSPVKPLNYHNGPVKLRNPVNRKYLCVEITGDSCAAASNYRLIMHRLLVFFFQVGKCHRLRTRTRDMSQRTA
jgi:hypothetical protein